jgi:hypothetical protein
VPAKIAPSREVVAFLARVPFRHAYEGVVTESILLAPCARGEG